MKNRLYIVLMIITSICFGQTPEEDVLSEIKSSLKYGNLEKVVFISDSVLETNDKNSLAAKVHLLLSEVYGRIADRGMQLTELNEARTIYESLKDDSGIAEVMYQLGRYYYSIGQVDTAGAMVVKADKLFQQDHNILGLAKINSLQGQIAYSNRRFEESAKHFRASIKKVDSVNDLTEMSLNRARLGYSLWRMNKPDSMLIEVRKAYKLAIMTEDSDLISNIQADLGLAFSATSQNDSAIYTLNQALTHAMQANAINRQSQIYNLLLLCYRQGGSFKDAYYNYRRADSIGRIATANNMSTLSNILRTHERNELLERDNTRFKQLVIFLAGTLLFLIFWVVIFYRQYTRTKLQVNLEKERRIVMQDAQQIMTQLPEIITGYDSEGNITFLNRMHDGTDPNEVVGKNLSEIVDQEEYTFRMSAIASAISEKRKVIAEHPSNDRLYMVYTSPMRLGSNSTEAITVYHDITEQHNRDKVIRWASATAKIGGWAVNLEKGVITWSDEIQKIREVEAKSPVLLSEAVNYYSPNHIPIIEQAIQKGINEGIPWDLELEMISAKGNRKWVRDVGIPEMRNGRCVGLRGVLQDITDRKKSELGLAEKERSLELALKGADLGTWDWSVITGEVIYNERWAEMLGYSVRALDSNYSTWENLLHPEDKPYVLNKLQEHLRGESDSYECEYRLLHKRGHWVWVLDKGKVVEWDNDGNAVRASGTHLEITEKKKYEFEKIKLQVKLKEFREAVNASSIVSITDLKGIIKYANQRFEEISQYSVNELIGRSHNIINSGFHSGAFWKEMWKTIGSGNVWRAEVKNKRKDGTYYWVDTFIIPLRGTRNKINEYLSIRNDISEKKENEIRLQRALSKAKESDRLKSLFLANISHEIRTPMNAIMGFSELLDRPNLSNKKRLEFGRLIYTRSRDLLTIMNDILDLSRLEARQLAIVNVIGNVRELFDKLLTTFQTEARYIRNKNIRYRAVNKLSDEQSIILTDFIRLHQVLYNLMSNAAKFTREGEVEIGCDLIDNQLTFWVRDTGIGIEQDKLSLVFQPFRQAHDSIHEQFGGSGLGLAICKGLVELWGGEIWCESRIDQGSTFYFTLPYIPADGFDHYPTKSQPSLKKA